jgi:hypothetical protein
MREVGKNGRHALWLDAMKAETAATRGDLDRMLAGYEVRWIESRSGLTLLQAAADYPATFFAPALMAAYPEAKLILSLRPEDSWLRSMTQTLIHAHHNPDVPTSGSAMRQLAEEYHARAWKNDFAANGQEAFRSHNDAVRQAAREQGRPLLEFDVSQGWKPLCDFLGVDVPAGDFPRDDAWKAYKERYAA